MATVNHFHGYSYRPLVEGDLPALLELYIASGRPETVYLRHEELIRNTVLDGRFLGVFKDMGNGEKKLFAASAIYRLGDGQKIAITTNSGQPSEEAVVWEHGSTLKRKHWDITNDNGLLPRHWAMDLLLIGPVVQLMSRARELQVDTIVGNVQHAARYVRKKISSPPHGWELIDAPAPELVKAFLATTDDPNTANQKDFLRVLPEKLYCMAHLMAKFLNSGEIVVQENGARDVIHVDFSGMPKPFCELVSMIDQQRTFFDNYKRRGLEHTSLSEVMRLFQRIETDLTVRGKGARVTATRPTTANGDKSIPGFGLGQAAA